MLSNLKQTTKEHAAEDECTSGHAALATRAVSEVYAIEVRVKLTEQLTRLRGRVNEATKVSISLTLHAKL